MLISFHGIVGTFFWMFLLIMAFLIIGFPFIIYDRKKKIETTKKTRRSSPPNVINIKKEDEK